MFDHFALGVNYWPRKSGVQMWQKFDANEIDTDFADLATIGIDTVRVFILWEDFQNIKEMPAYQMLDASPVDVRMSDWSETSCYVNQERIEHFDTVIALARKHGFKLIPTLFTTWMSGTVFDPPFRQGRDIFSDPSMLRYQVYLARFFAQRYCNETQILAWDLANEQNCVVPCESYDAGWLWTYLLANELRKWDSNHVVTSGMHGLTNTRTGKAGFNISDMADGLDFLCVHPYPLFFPDMCQDRDDNIRTSYFAEFQNRLYEGIGRKPVMMEEFGTFGNTIMSEEIGAEYTRMVLNRLYGAGSLGAIHWCAFNFECRTQPPYNTSPSDVNMGLFRKDGTPNLVGEEFKKFAAFLKEMGGFQCKPETAPSAILVPYRQENQSILYSTFVLGKMAQLDCEFAVVQRGLDDYKLAFVPCCTSFETFTIQDWDAVREWVEAGGTAYFSYNGFQFPEQDEFFGIKTIIRQKEPNSAGNGRFVGGPDYLVGKVFSYNRTRKWRLIVEPAGASVLASDETGKPLILEHRHGKGKVILATEPVEHYIAEMPDVLPENKLYLLYAYLADIAGISREQGMLDPNIEKFKLVDGRRMTIDFHAKNVFIESEIGR